MTRVTRYKLLYVLIVALGMALVLPLASIWSTGLVGTVVLIALLLIPGRLLGVLWRDPFRGRLLLSKGEPSEAIRGFQAFLATLEAQPWRRRVWWLGWSVYTRDPKAIVLNNIGAAQLRLGLLSEAETSFHAALAEDQDYAVPCFNLGLVAHVRSDETRAEEWFARSRRLGYTKSLTDKMVTASSAALAQIVGRIGVADNQKDP